MKARAPDAEQLGRVIRDGELADGRRQEPPPENPPPGDKWQARLGLQRLGLPGASSAVAYILIDYANGKTGLCYPSPETIAEVLKLNPRAVRRAVAHLKAEGLVRVIVRRSAKGSESNIYLINWQRLFDAYNEMMRTKAAARGRTKAAAKLRKSELRESELRALSGDGFADAAPKGATNGCATEAKRRPAEKSEKRLAYEAEQMRKYCRRERTPPV